MKSEERRRALRGLGTWGNVITIGLVLALAVISVSQLAAEAQVSNESEENSGLDFVSASAIACLRVDLQSIAAEVPFLEEEPERLRPADVLMRGALLELATALEENTGLSWEDISPLFGEELTIALTALQAGEVPEMILVLRPTSEADVAGTLNKLRAIIEEKVGEPFSQVYYGTIPIGVIPIEVEGAKVVDLPEVTVEVEEKVIELSGATVDGFILAGSSLEAVKVALDAYHGWNGGAISGEEGYQKLSGLLEGKPQIICYISELASLIPEVGEAEVRALSGGRFMKGVSLIEGELKTQTIFDPPEEMRQAYRKLGEVPTVDLALLERLPKEPLVLIGWSTFVRFWDMLKKMSKTQPAIAALQAAIGWRLWHLGVDLEQDLLNWVGDTQIFALYQPEEPTLPGIVFLCSVTDEAEAREGMLALEALLQREYGVVVEALTIEGQQVRVLNFPDAPEPLAVTYFIKDGALIATSDLPTMEAVVAHQKSPDGSAADALVEMPPEVQGLVMMDFPAMTKASLYLAPKAGPALDRPDMESFLIMLSAGLSPFGKLTGYSLENIEGLTIERLTLPIDYESIRELISPAALGLSVVVAIIPEAREKARQAACISNLKQLALGMIMYADDHDGFFPPAEEWCDAIMPYVGSEEVFKCPKTGEYGYAMNSELSGVKLSDIQEPPLTILLFESYKAEWNAFDPVESLAPDRHRGGNNVAYADGHVEFVREGEMD